MPYTAIPSQSDGNTLTATYLNTVADDIEYLNGVVERPNVGFHAIQGTLTSQSPKLVTLIHLHRYIHYQVVVTGTGDAVALKAGTDGSTFGNTILNDGSSPTGTYTGYADTDGWGLTVGAPYYVEASWSMGDASLVKINYIIESDSTSI